MMENGRLNVVIVSRKHYEITLTSFLPIRKRINVFLSLNEFFFHPILKMFGKIMIKKNEKLKDNWFRFRWEAYKDLSFGESERIFLSDDDFVYYGDWGKIFSTPTPFSVTWETKYEKVFSWEEWNKKEFHGGSLSGLIVNGRQFERIKKALKKGYEAGELVSEDVYATLRLGEVIKRVDFLKALTFKPEKHDTLLSANLNKKFYEEVGLL